MPTVGIRIRQSTLLDDLGCALFCINIEQL